MKTMGCFGSGANEADIKKAKLKSDMTLYLQRKRTVKLPKNIENYLSMLQDITSIGYKKTLKKHKLQQITSPTQNFYKNFDKLDKSQQHYYLLQLIIQVDRRIFDRQQLHIQKTITVDTNDLNETLMDSGQLLEGKCKYSSAGQTTLGFIRKWHEVILKLNKQKNKLIIKHKNSLFSIPLRSYAIVKKPQDFVFILESTHEFEQSHLKTVFFQFTSEKKQNYEQLYESILDVIICYQIDKLMMENIFNQKFQKLDDTKRNKIRLYLTQNNIRKCKNIIELYEKESAQQRTYQRTVLKEDYQNKQYMLIKQYKNSEGTWYESEAKIFDRHEPAKINFLEIYQNSHKHLIKFNILETFVRQKDAQNQKTYPQADKKLCAFYQKLKIDGKVYGQQLFLQRSRHKPQRSQRLIFLNLDHVFNENFIAYLKVTLTPVHKKQNPQDGFMLNTTVKFNSEFYDSKYGSEYFVEFIKQFYTMFERLRNSSVQEHSEFNIKEMNSKFYIEKDLISRFGEDDESPIDFLKSNATPSSYNLFNRRNSLADIPSNAYLRRKHEMAPTSQKIGKMMKQHFLYKEWQRLPKGGLKCINYQLVSFQKSLYKSVVKKFGQNLLKGKNIINFSLPVVCFKKQSHLQSLAQSMCYCPIHLQKAAKIKNPLQRMKFSVIIMIAVGILTVQSEKPFNPILGQTYQGNVDGCPVYLEQISHHPPISAYYMVGRGYKMYGCVEPRISLLLNGATGYSNLPHYIEFDDGTIIEVIFAKITITGMLIGDRQFFFEDKIYAFDKKNNLFTELIFGPYKSGGMFSSSSEPQDYFHGKIYEITDKFRQNFSKYTPRIYPSKTDIVREHLMFDGIWSGSVHMDGQEIINFKTDLPYEFVQEQYPMPSDSRYRKDLQKLIEGDKQAAQTAKQQMEQSQRRDKKLRTK